MADETKEASASGCGDEYYDFDFDITTPQEYEDTVIEDDKNVDLSVPQSDHPPVKNNSPSTVHKTGYSRSSYSDEKYCTKPDSTSSTLINDPNIDQTERSFIQTNCGKITRSSTKRIGLDLPQNMEDIIVSGDQPTIQNKSKIDLNSSTPEEHYHNSEIIPSMAASPEPYMVAEISPDPLLPSPRLSQITNSKNQAKTNQTSDFDFINYDREYVPAHENTDEKVELSNLIINYQSSEYALFPSTESDDPDTFFITDRSVIHKPLSELFKEIREVVNQDLGDDGELFISVPDFGLQVEETSSSHELITLSQITLLHSQLQLNDGIDIPQPMYIDLGIKKNFSKSLEKYNSAAKCGKGLSEIISWDENSEKMSFHGLEEDLISFQDNQNFITPAENNTQASPSCTEFDPDSEKEFKQLEQPGNNFIEHDQEFYIDVSRSINEEENASSIRASPEAFSGQSKPLTETGITNSNSPFESNFDEDGDIIDYSDNESSERLSTSIKHATTIINEHGSDIRETKGVLVNTSFPYDEDKSYPVDDSYVSEKSSPSHARTNYIPESTSIREEELGTINSEAQGPNEDSQKNYDNRSISEQEYNENSSRDLDNSSINGEFQIISTQGGKNFDEAQENEAEYDNEVNYEENIEDGKHKNLSSNDEDEDDLITNKVTTTFGITDKSASCDSRSSERMCVNVRTDDTYLNDSTLVQAQKIAQKIALKPLEAKVNAEAVEADDVAEKNYFAQGGNEVFHNAEDSDEIGYDEEDEEIFPHLDSPCNPDAIQSSTEIISPISGKRSRTESELDNSMDDNSSKRLRSFKNPSHYLKNL